MALYVLDAKVYAKNDKQKEKLFFPVYSPQAGGEFGAVGFVMCNALTAFAVTRTILLRAWAIDVVVGAGHGG